MTAGPTARSLEFCRKRGIRAGVVEKWLPARGDMPHGRRQDLFGCIDIIAMPLNVLHILAIQATSLSNVNARLVKAMDLEGELLWDTAGDFMRDWLTRGNRFEVWGWGKRKKRVNGKLWRLRRVAVRLRAGVLETVDVSDC